MPVVLGVTGPLGAGRTEVSRYLAKEAGFTNIALSDILRERAVAQGIGDPSIEQLQNLGDELLGWDQELARGRLA